MASRVELGFRDAADRWLPRQTHLLAAVSGGADSVALAHLLQRFARRREWTVTIAHLDHGLRRGSATDRRFVKRLANELEFECVSTRRDVGALRRRDESLEEAARRVRREFLMETVDEIGADSVVTAHHRDDQAETVLMRLLRGVGPSSLRGIDPEGPGPFVRPLLQLERNQLRTWLTRNGWTWREDASNRDLRFDRNRVRRQLMPLLESSYNAQAADHLVRTAEQLRTDSAYLDRLATRAYRRIGSALSLDATALARQDPAVASRVAILALRDAGMDPRRITSRHVVSLLDLAQGCGGRSADLPGRIRAVRRGDRIRIARRRE
ncbi:MAG: tRNA lysidine(34) synthetase TilS [Acidobacteriota bacterium]|nr:tRNA lysidine(34) synthetase TilS [Acidobacteriota bacterium]